MADFQDKTRAVIPPMDGDQVPGHWVPQRLAGTGTTEASNSRRLAKGHLHELVVGAEAVRASFRPEGGLANAVATTSFIIPANTVYPFLALLGPDSAYGSLFVYIEAADGASAYEAFVQQRSR